MQRGLNLTARIGIIFGNIGDGGYPLDEAGHEAMTRNREILSSIG